MKGVLNTVFKRGLWLAVKQSCSYSLCKQAKHGAASQQVEFIPVASSGVKRWHLLGRHQPLSTREGILRDKKKGNQLSKVKAEGKIHFKGKLEKTGSLSICTTACFPHAPCQNVGASTQDCFPSYGKETTGNRLCSNRPTSSRKPVKQKTKNSTYLKLIIWKNAGITQRWADGKYIYILLKASHWGIKIQDASLTDPRPWITVETYCQSSSLLWYL